MIVAAILLFAAAKMIGLGSLKPTERKAQKVVEKGF